VVTYVDEAARIVLARAQADLDVHAVSSADGACLACRTVGPCPAYEAASRTFARYGAMPRRRPGLTRPELFATRPAGVGGWFGAS
jgi:hypothetical protein